MKKLKYILYLSLLFFFLSIDLYSLSGDIQCSIRYFNKKIYYEGDQIELRVELFNNSPENFSFQTTDPKYYNTKITIKDLTGKELTDKYKFTRETIDFQPIYYRNMTILPGEMFAFNILLNDIIDLSEPGLYFIRLEFFVKANSDTVSLKSNVLDLSLRPNTGVSEVQKIIDYETGEILRREKKGPDEVVKYAIEALQKNEFDKFFLYLDLKSIMLKSQIIREQYSRLSAEKQQKILEDYKLMLEKNMKYDFRTADAEAIIYRPIYYEILKTWYTDSNAEVIVTEKFKYEQLTEIKEYTYKLKKVDGIWVIYDYLVMNKGIE